MEKQQHELFNEAKEFLKSKDTCSCSELQIHFKLGYNSAGRLMDELEEVGAIGCFGYQGIGSKSRKVLIK